MNSLRLKTVGFPILVLLVFILVSSLLRPVIWPDETRYLTVAWEMWLRGNFVVPTVNFEFYHHKPPLLFWVIDIFWAVFGVSRFSALLGIFAISTTSILLTRRLAEELFPGERDVADRIGWAMLGNVVFVIYSGQILFDLLLTCCVLGALICLLVEARSEGEGRLFRIALCGLSLGLGVLAKGPVVLIFVLWPVATYPWWRGERQVIAARLLWGFIGLCVLVALIPVALWLVPALISTGGEFGRALIWQQTAGRITGNLANSHDRPFWFYLPLLPIFAMPWIFSPYVWRAHRGTLGRLGAVSKTLWHESWAVRFLIVWIVPVVLTFSLIGGKQPHYLVPLLPAFVVASAVLMRRLSIPLIRLGALLTLGFAILAQGGAALSVFKTYDLAPIRQEIADHSGPVAFVGDYEGEFNFLDRLRRPMSVITDEQASSWLKAHPDGMLVDLFNRPSSPIPGRIVYEAKSSLNRSMAVSVGTAVPAP